MNQQSKQTTYMLHTSTKAIVMCLKKTPNKCEEHFKTFIAFSPPKCAQNNSQSLLHCRQDRGIKRV